MIPERDIWRAANLLIREHKLMLRSSQPGEPVRCSTAAIVMGNCLAGYQAGDRPIASSARKQTELTSAFRCPHVIRKDFQITRYAEDV